MFISPPGSRVSTPCSSATRCPRERKGLVLCLEVARVTRPLLGACCDSVTALCCSLGWARASPCFSGEFEIPLLHPGRPAGAV